ncbi:hydrolase [Bacillaceae bacterium SAOS 7]|nr:hydrolase [Bacillaceae bacterium SAOS 7]
MVIRIVEPGIRTTIQDMGRFGYYHLGVPPSGAADKYSYVLGNIMLGNPRHFAALEMMIKGASVEFQKKTVAVVTGAPAEVRLNGELIPLWQPFIVQPGDVLSVGAIREGVFAYLCVSGGLATPEMLGSRSVCLASEFAGVLGRSLLKGDLLPLHEPLPGAIRQVGKTLPAEAHPSFSKEMNIRLVMGLTCDRIKDEGLVGLLNRAWVIQTESNRVAYRLHGGRVNYKEEVPPFGSGNSFGNIVDIPYPIGGVIVPNEEELIILMTDGTGGGGYVTIGTVIRPDLNLLAQTRPQSKVRFHAVTIDQAFQIRREIEQKVEKVKEIVQQV